MKESLSCPHHARQVLPSVATPEVVKVRGAEASDRQASSSEQIADGGFIWAGVDRREGFNHPVGSVQCQRGPASVGACSMLSISAATA